MSAASTDSRARGRRRSPRSRRAVSRSPAVSIEQEGDAADRHRRLDQIARGARRRRHDRRLAPANALNKARLAGIGRAGDHDPDAILEPLGRRPRQPSARFRSASAPSRRRSRRSGSPTSSSSEKSSAASTCAASISNLLPPRLDLPAERAARQRQRLRGAAPRSRPRAGRRAPRPRRGRCGHSRRRGG